MPALKYAKKTSIDTWCLLTKFLKKRGRFLDIPTKFQKEHKNFSLSKDYWFSLTCPLILRFTRSPPIERKPSKHFRWNILWTLWWALFYSQESFSNSPKLFSKKWRKNNWKQWTGRTNHSTKEKAKKLFSLCILI